MMNLEELLKSEHASIQISKTKPENNDDAILRRRKDFILFLSAITILVGAALFCGYIVFKSISINPALAGIGLNGITGIALGVGGYVLRGKSHS